MGRGQWLLTRLQLLHREGLRHDEGATATEYAVLMALIFATIVVAVRVLGPVLADLLSNYSTQLASAQS